ncbi:MAG: prenyltransferase/squalene oxidase repeat-containing protein, partial [Bacteroidota bacterium]|nr:prenyltransferase/squalene oxidase repeat-containing protein [Bacteroidota bacterium]
HQHVNQDGGFGDTPESASNVSSSLLCYAALSFVQGRDIDNKPLLMGIENYLAAQGISFTTHDLTASVLAYYGKDFTFSVPILSMLALCEVLSDDVYRHIPQLPFEFALLPSSLYRFFNLQVVSYAVPALIAVGIYIFKHRKRHNAISKYYRTKCIVPAMKKLSAMLPASGGFLEAIPLTGFVCMCLIDSGMQDNEVVKKGVSFLKNQQRPDGSWPIDTDLSTWITTLSIKSLGRRMPLTLDTPSVAILRRHLLNIQYKEKHPFNDAQPGGWGWTNFAGSVPDADDTPGAIIALLEMSEGTREEFQAILNGCKWLTNLQNRDGGIPSFCKGWGRLPFDRSCADLSGHTLLALLRTLDMFEMKMEPRTLKNLHSSSQKIVRYLEKHQHPEGYWLPLWFGNQLTADKTNPVYGTAKVLTYIEDCLTLGSLTGMLKTRLEKMAASAGSYLKSQQNDDGSWGGGKGIAGTIEETALSVCALAKADKTACLRGLQWLEKTHSTKELYPSPIGLYFATLWYDEKMYPLIYYIEALRRYLE